MPMPRTGNEAAHWAGGLNSAAAYIANRPAMLAAARQRASQMQVNQQRGQQYQAQAALLAQKLSDLKLSADDREALGKAAQDAAPFIQAGKMDAPEVYKFSGLIAKVTAANKGHPAAEMLTSLGLPQPNTKYTADARAKATTDAATTRAEASKENAKTAAAEKLAAAGLNRYASVNSNGAVYDKQSGTITQQNISPNTGKGEGAYETVEYDKVPGTDPVPGTPAIPARTGFFGIGKRDAVPAQPGIPGTPAILKRTVKRPLNSGQTAAALAATGVNVRPTAAPGEGSEETNPDVEPTEQAAPSPTVPNQPAAAAAAPAQTEAQPVKVRVLHPNGTPGFIPATQVDAALKAGFKLAKQPDAPVDSGD